MSKESFNNFGYDTEQACCVCGKRPAKVEPRFLYPVCEDCCDIPPVTISKIRKDGK